MIHQNSTRRGRILRPLIHLALFGVAWWLLSSWYFEHQTFKYFLFLAIFIPVAVSIVGPYFRRDFPGISLFRKITVLILAVIALPLSDWLKLNPNTVTREWTRQLFLDSLCLYFLYVIFDSFPGLKQRIVQGFRHEISRASSKQFLYWLPPVLYVLISSWIALSVYQKIPLIEDSSSHLFQARIFSHFKIYAATPPDRDFFSYHRDLIVMKDNRWFGMYPPGFALMLGAFMLIGAEWLLSPLLGALTIVIWMAYARRWHGRMVALVVGVLMLASPLLLVMTSSVMVHTPELFLASAIIYLCRLHTDRRLRFSEHAMLFVVLILAVLVRFFSILVFLSPVLGYSVFKDGLRKNRALVATLTAGFLVGFAALGWFQWRTTGSPFVTGYQLEYQGMPGHRIGFGKAGAGEVHTPLRGLENTSDNLLALDSWLSGLFTGSILFVLAFFLLNVDTEPWDWVLLLSCLAIAFFYFLYFFQDLTYGPRYFFLMVPVFLLFISRLLLFRNGKQVHSALAACFLASFVLSIPLRIPDFIQQCSPVDRMAGNLARAIEKLDNKKTLVFLDREITLTFLNWNDPELKSPIILCLDLRDRNAQIQKRFHDFAVGYFRPVSDMEKNDDGAQYRIYPTPETRQEGHITAYQVALSFLAASDYPDSDIFDICYADLLRLTYLAPSRLAYVTQQLNQPGKDADYRAQFRTGIYHATKLILLPQDAYARDHQKWNTILDYEQFRQEFQSAKTNMKLCGEVGNPILLELDKVSRRIDQDGNGTFSNDEIARFVTSKHIH